MEQEREYGVVDLFKMFCAVLVMLIHTKPFENIFWLDAGIGLLTRFAVPFFFTISGYFLFRKFAWVNIGRFRIIQSYLLRLLRFYIIWFILLRIVDIVFDDSQIHSIRYYIKQFFFTTDGSALWFVEALIWAIVIVSFLSIWVRKKTIFFIGVSFLIIGYCFSTLLGVTGKWHIVQILKPVVSYTGIQGGLYFAFPYVSLGAMMAESNIEPLIKRDCLFVFLFFICLGAESILMVMKCLAPLTFLWISALPMTYFVTRLTLTIPLKKGDIYYGIRKISTLCYVFHIAVFKVLKYYFFSSGFSEKDPEHLFLTILTLMITISSAYIILQLSRIKAFSWLKHVM